LGANTKRRWAIPAAVWAPPWLIPEEARRARRGAPDCQPENKQKTSNSIASSLTRRRNASPATRPRPRRPRRLPASRLFSDAPATPSPSSKSGAPRSTAARCRPLCQRHQPDGNAIQLLRLHDRAPISRGLGSLETRSSAPPPMDRRTLDAPDRRRPRSPPRSSSSDTRATPDGPFCPGKSAARTDTSPGPIHEAPSSKPARAPEAKRNGPAALAIEPPSRASTAARNFSTAADPPYWWPSGNER